MLPTNKHTIAENPWKIVNEFMNPDFVFANDQVDEPKEEILVPENTQSNLVSANRDYKWKIEPSPKRKVRYIQLKTLLEYIDPVAELKKIKGIVICQNIEDIEQICEKIAQGKIEEIKSIAEKHHIVKKKCCNMVMRMYCLTCKQIFGRDKASKHDCSKLPNPNLGDMYSKRLCMRIDRWYKSPNADQIIKDKTVLGITLCPNLLDNIEKMIKTRCSKTKNSDEQNEITTHKLIKEEGNYFCDLCKIKSRVYCINCKKSYGRSSIRTHFFACTVEKITQKSQKISSHTKRQDAEVLDDDRNTKKPKKNKPYNISQKV